MKKMKAIRNGKEYFGHQRFYQILDQLAELHSNKNHDYAGTRHPLANLLECGEAGVNPWKGVIVRLTDKMSRLKSYARQGEFLVKNEGLIDTFRDMAVYSILGIILYEEENAKERGVSDSKTGGQSKEKDNPKGKGKR